MEKILKQISIDVDKQYELLRQEVLKRLEFQNTLLTINSVFVATFFGIGIKNSNLFLLFIPPVEWSFAMIAKHNVYYMTKIDFYIRKRFKNKDSSMLWETFDIKFAPKILFYQIVLNLGSYAIYLIYSVIPLLVAIFSSDKQPLNMVLIWIDFISILLIVGTFFFFDWGRIQKGLDEQLETILTNHNQDNTNSDPQSFIEIEGVSK